jgi:hypothetical protein
MIKTTSIRHFWKRGGLKERREKSVVKKHYKKTGKEK